MHRKIGQRDHDPEAPAFSRKDLKKGPQQGFTIDDFVYVGDETGSLSDATINALCTELTSPEASLRQIVRPLLERHPSADMSQTVDIRLDDVVATILGKPRKKGRKPQPSQDRLTLDVAKEYWQSLSGFKTPRSLARIINDVLEKSGVEFADVDRRQDFVKNIRRKFEREKDRLLTQVSRGTDYDVRRQRAQIDHVLECLLTLGLLD